MREGGTTPPLWYIRGVAIAAAITLGMFAAYQLGMAGGALPLLVVPIGMGVLVVWAVSSLAVDWPRRARGADEAARDRFRIELERSRRHERPLSLVRISPTPRSGEWDVPPVGATEVREAVRTIDAVWSEHGHVYVLMPETERIALARAASRMLVRLPGLSAGDLRAAVYPEDGLTSGALFLRLESPDAEPRPADIVHLAPQQDATAEERLG